MQSVASIMKDIMSYKLDTMRKVQHVNIAVIGSAQSGKSTFLNLLYKILKSKNSDTAADMPNYTPGA